MPRVRREIARPNRWKLLARRNRRNLRLAGWAVCGFAVVMAGVFVTHSAETGGAVAMVQERFGRAIDMRVQEIRIDGRSNTPEQKLLDALQVTKGAPILSFSVQEARRRIENLSWVEHVAVERRLPGTIYVDLTERRPFAIWQYQGKFQLIDRAGNVVIDEDVTHFLDLPLVVGLGAPAHASDMLNALAAVPDIHTRVQAIVCVGGRRWNLDLKNHVTIMLPEGHEVAALARLADLQSSQQLLDRPLLFVDMRLPDRMAVRVRPAPPAPLDGRQPDAKQPDAKQPDAKQPDAKQGEPAPAQMQDTPARRAT